MSLKTSGYTQKETSFILKPADLPLNSFFCPSADVMCLGSIINKWSCHGDTWRYSICEKFSCSDRINKMMHLCTLLPITLINIKAEQTLRFLFFFYSCWGMQVLVQRRHLSSCSWSSCVYNHWSHSLHRLATQERYNNVYILQWIAVSLLHVYCLYYYPQLSFLFLRHCWKTEVGWFSFVGWKKSMMPKDFQVFQDLLCITFRFSASIVTVPVWFFML